MIAAILLAAGRGRRFGGDKLLATLDGEPVVRQAAGNLLAVGLEPVVVVVAADESGRRVEEALAGLPVQCVRHEQADAGMGTSIARGVATLPDVCDAVMIALADQPRVDPIVLRALMTATAGSRERIAVPSYRGQRANPVLFGRDFFRELAALDGHYGARSVVDRHAHSVVEVPVDADVPIDVDTVADLERIRAQVSVSRTRGLE